jgi:hypothetical protein
VGVGQVFEFRHRVIGASQIIADTKFYCAFFKQTLNLDRELDRRDPPFRILTVNPRPVHIRLNHQTGLAPIMVEVRMVIYSESFDIAQFAGFVFLIDIACKKPLMKFKVGPLVNGTFAV